MDSIEGRTAKLTSQIQEFWYTLIDSEVVKEGISLLSSLLDMLTKIIDQVGILGTIGIGTGTFLSSKMDLSQLFKNVGRDKMHSLINSYIYECI